MGKKPFQNYHVVRLHLGSHSLPGSLACYWFAHVLFFCCLFVNTTVGSQFSIFLRIFPVVAILHGRNTSW